jgi:predicted nuclease of predicted toxin-antitoxin system
MKKLLLDECIPHRIRQSLPEFDTYTVTFMGWSGIKNGKLLQLAIDNDFDIFLTTDKNLPYQQNATKFPIAIVVFNVIKDDTETILLLLPKLKLLIENFQKNRIYVIE